MTNQYKVGDKVLIEAEIDGVDLRDVNQPIRVRIDGEVTWPFTYQIVPSRQPWDILRQAASMMSDRSSMARELRDRAAFLEEKAKPVSLKKAAEDALESLRYVQSAYPQACGWGTRAERIKQLEQALEAHKD